MRHSGIFSLYAARAVRGFGDGFAAILLPVYLSEIGFDPLRIGVIASSALLGSAALTLAAGFLASRFNLRTLLMGCAILMVLTGAALPFIQHFAVVALVAFVGTINPTTGDIGVHVPLEHACLAQGAADADRTSVFARYSLIGALSIAAGALCAATPELLTSAGMQRIHSLQLMFYLYAALGVAAAALYARLPREHARDVRPTPLGPSRGMVYKLAALFSLDAFAGGFAVQSLLALWLFERFDLSLVMASTFFFWSNVFAAFSYPVAARLGRQFGLVNTMVFTHIPSSICLVVAAFSSSLTVVLVLLLVRSAFSNMDVPTRTSFVMAVVTPAERAAAASVTAVPRSLASAISPTLAGALLSSSFAGLPLVACGILKIIYDVSLLFSFRHVKPPEEMEPAAASESRATTPRPWFGRRSSGLSSQRE